MGIINSIVSLFMAPFEWLQALIKSDRFIIYPGQVVQFIGLPGSGKTMGASVMIKRSSDKLKMGVISTPDAGLKFGTVCDVKKLLCSYRINNKIVMIDESSLNGFDSREWSTNFKGDGKKALAQLKLCRHYRNSFITTSQNLNDNDGKIRDGLVKSTYVCHSIMFKKFILCERATIIYTFEDGNYKQHIYLPSLFKKIVDPYSFYIIYKKKAGKLYNSWATVDIIDNLPEYKGQKEIPEPCYRKRKSETKN